MMVWLWSFIGILVLLILGLLFKIHMLRKAAGEIADGFADRLVTDTNTPIGISGRDRQMRRLADAVNEQLRRLRAEHHRFCQGDAELKGAVTNLSHDLRTPLTAICGYLDLLEKEEKSEAAKRYIDIIRNRSQLLVSMTEELFQYSVLLSRENNAPGEPVVLNQVLEESIAAVEPLPLVPAMWMNFSFFSGLPSLASSSRVRSRPSLLPCQLTEWIYLSASS